MDKFIKPEDIKTIEDLEIEVEKVLLMADKGAVRILVASVIANMMNLNPVWLMLIAPPSGGKSELIMCVEGLPFIFPISDLTVNTFASGQKKAGKETSLLHKIGNGIMTFKDFTSILSKNKEARKEIMGQLREVFDGSYVKRTGTGDDIIWGGKIGAIAGATEIVYRYLEELSAMGDRFIMYNIIQPDRMEVAMRTLNNSNKMQANREHLRQCFHSYINYVLSKSKYEEINLSEDMKKELLEVADFATRVRSAVMTDFKSGLVDFVPSPEMPMRVTSQLSTLGAGLIAMDKANPKFLHSHISFKGELSEQNSKLLFKAAFDSIPRTRRDALVPLAKYKQGISTAGLATKLGLPTSSVAKYLQQVNALGICTRTKGRGKGDVWIMVEKYREIMLRIEKIEVVDELLLGDESDDDYNENWEEIDTKRADLEVDNLEISL